ncbi:MAG TPA: hypothetical protein VGM90_03935 [Kofleriaceae bacterium]|jgi:hypothetical protein
MKRIILMALTGLTLSSGVALADRHGGGHDRREERQDHREIRQDRREIRQDRREDHRWDRRADSRWGGNRTYVRSRPVYRNNTWYFNGGVTRTYHRPEIRYHYRNYYQRPTILVENYDPMPGYVWVAGNWAWSGFEWTWSPGHYEVDANYDGY